ncbi:MAG: hypothetical protein RIQ89_1728 [Bacteroidota bacterium]
MRILSSGNVGIGTTSPGSTLDVKGTLRLSGSTSGYVGFTPAAAAGSTTYTLPSADGTSGQYLKTNGSGTLSWATPSASITSVSNTSSTNTLSTTVNGVSGSGVNIINTNTLTAASSAITSTLNGVASTLTPSSGTIGTSTYLGFDASGNLVKGSVTGAWSTIGNASTTAGTNYIGTSDAVDFVTKTNATERMRITSSGRIGIGGISSPSYLVSLVGTAAQTIGLERNATTSGNGSNLTILAGGAPSGQGNRTGGDLYLSSGTSTGTGTSNMYFNTAPTNGAGNSDNAPTTRMTILGNGNIGIGTTSPGSTLDVKGTLRLSGSTSGYVGFAPAAAAGSTTYTLPSADGTSGQQLTTNGSGTLSWAAAGSSSGWSLTGNSGTTAGTNYIGTSDNIDVTFKRNATNAGTLGATSTSFGVSSSATGTSAVAIGASATANYQYSTAIGASADASTTDYSTAIGYDATCSGHDAVSVGSNSSVSANFSVVVGHASSAAYTNCVVVGKSISATAANQIVLGNSTNTICLVNGASSGASKALIVGNGSTNGNGAYLTTGGTWTNSSDRNLKEDIQSINNDELLKKISNLDVTQWKYKGTNEYHIGPMAQDFYKAFGLGTDDKHISTIDPSGVSLAAIKALNEKVEAQQLMIEELIKEIKELKK